MASWRYLTILSYLLSVECSIPVTLVLCTGMLAKQNARLRLYEEVETMPLGLKSKMALVAASGKGLGKATIGIGGANKFATKSE